MTKASEQQQQQPSPVLTILSLLDTYAAKHEQGNTLQKQSFWNLYKARHRAAARGLLGNNTLQASDVREELRARCVLLRQKEDGTFETEPDLVHDDDDDDKKDSRLTESAPRFVLADAVEQKQEAEKENAATATSAATSSTSTTEATAAAAGLRNRKKTSSQQTPAVGQAAKDDKDDAKTKWTVEEQETSTVETLDEEGRLLAADPLLLFGGGLPPRELMVAQSQAKEALAMYIEAANLIAEIQHELSVVQKVAKK
jgi:hypothetical protein